MRKGMDWQYLLQERKGIHSHQKVDFRTLNTNNIIDDTPGVGQYNLHQQNLSTKLMKEEYDWMELAPKRAAFNSSIPRFEAKKIEES